MNRTLKISTVLSFSLLAACGSDASSGIDSGIGTDGPSGTDASIVDAGPPDAEPAPDAFVATCSPVSGTNVAADTLATGMDRPVYLTAPAGDARFFVVEQPGVIQLFIDDVVQTTPYLDIRALVRDNGNEQGLLGLAFHPNYATNGRFYVNYTASSPSGDTVIAEYTVSADTHVADPASARILMTIEQPFSNHNGGMIDFGPDGYLYIGVGDGGSGGDPLQHGQNTSTLLGSMLRIDVDDTTAGQYGIPADNPFADSANGINDPRPEIWASGLRNPWRFSFDRSTGDLYIGDVGQNEIEEIDVQLASSTGGENYGWRTMEGSSCFNPSVGCDETGLVLPFAEYSHAGGGCSIAGGYAYRGTCMPDMVGKYLVTDFCTNIVSTLTFPSDNTLEVLSNSLGSNITSFGQDAAGELYVLTLGGSVARIITTQP